MSIESSLSLTSIMCPADEPNGAQAVLDMGTLVDAIHVGNGSHLELRRLRIPNCASRHVYKPSAHVRLRVAGIFALWPSITLAINSSVSALCPCIAPSSFPPRVSMCLLHFPSAADLPHAAQAVWQTALHHEQEAPERALHIP